MNTEEKKDLTNKFREDLEKKDIVLQLEQEVATFGETEMMKRDQYATMLQLRLQKLMMADDKKHCENGIVLYEKFLRVLEGLPLSAAREGIIKMISQQLTDITMQAALEFHRPNEVQLNALEALFPRKLPDGFISEANGPQLEDDDPDDFDHLDDGPGEQKIDVDEASEELADDVEADATAYSAAKAEQKSN